MRINGKMQIVEQGTCTPVEFIPPDHAKARRLPTQEDVLSHCHFSHERKLLIDNGDTRLFSLADIRKPLLNAFDRDLTTVLRMRIHAAEHLHQSRLAGPVLTNQRMNLSAMKIKTDAIESANTRERLSDVQHLQKRRWAFRIHSKRKLPGLDNVQSSSFSLPGWERKQPQVEL